MRKKPALATKNAVPEQKRIKKLPPQGMEINPAGGSVFALNEPASARFLQCGQQS